MVQSSESRVSISWQQYLVLSAHARPCLVFGLISISTVPSPTLGLLDFCASTVTEAWIAHASRSTLG
jgi:hypothetical protein